MLTSDHSIILSWSQRFHQGQDSTEDMEHSSRLKTDNASAAIIVTILEEDRHMTGNYDANNLNQKLHPKNYLRASCSWKVECWYSVWQHISHIIKRQFSSINRSTAPPPLQSYEYSWFQYLPKAKRTATWPMIAVFWNMNTAMNWHTGLIKCRGQLHGI